VAAIDRGTGGRAPAAVLRPYLQRCLPFGSAFHHEVHLLRAHIGLVRQALESARADARSMVPGTLATAP